MACPSIPLSGLFPMPGIKRKYVRVTLSLHPNQALAALKSHLYEQDGSYLHLALKVANKAGELPVAILREDGHSVGCGVLTPDHLLMVYVKPEYRQQAYGSKIVKRFRQYARLHGFEDALHAQFGNDVPASRKFWIKNNVQLPTWY